MVSLGVMALEEGGRVDFERLRRARRDRVFEAMARHDLDALVLGREANARYASGARRLWVAGTRPFGPGCVLVRSTGETHLMTTWDEGIPDEIPRAHLYGMSWDPMNMVASLQGIDGLAGARRVGVDGMTPLWRGLLARVAPHARLVEAQSTLRALRMRKTPDEVLCVRTAVAIAEAALSAAAEAIRPGVRERDLLGVFDQRMTDFGVTAPAMEGTFCRTEPCRPGEVPRLRRLVSDRAIDQGALVALSGGVLYAGYEGSVGRTWPCLGPTGRTVLGGQRELYRRWLSVRERVLDACRPGASGRDLREAYEASGEPLPAFPVAYSSGMGYEAPIAGSSLGPTFDATWRLEPGMVLGVQEYVAGPEGGFLGLDTILVTEDGVEVLSTLGHGPLADAG